jgi:hypothetical protein
VLLVLREAAAEGGEPRVGRGAVRGAVEQCDDRLAKGRETVLREALAEAPADRCDEGAERLEGLLVEPRGGAVGQGPLKDGGLDLHALDVALYPAVRLAARHQCLEAGGEHRPAQLEPRARRFGLGRVHGRAQAHRHVPITRPRP